MDRRGLRGLSAAIDRLLDHRIYRDHTVDAVLQDQALLLTEEAWGRMDAPPALDRFGFETLVELRPFLATVARQAAPATHCHEKLRQLAAFTSSLEHRFPSPQHSAARGYYRSPRDFMWGGTEEFVIAKGSDWCNEVARVYCALAQLCSIPARIVYHFSDHDGHVIAECFGPEGWVLVDPLAPKIYRDPTGLAIGAVRMARAKPAERELYTSGHEGYYVAAEFVRYLAVSDYYLIDAADYHYGLSPCNDFYAELLGPKWNR